MENLLINGTHKTPSINFDAKKGLIEIKGVSTPENCIDFYQPLVDWLKNYLANPIKPTIINIHLTYLNTNSSKWILHILKKFENIYTKNNSVTINWYCDEDDEIMMESGEDYQSILNVPVNIIESG